MTTIINVKQGEGGKIFIVTASKPLIPEKVILECHKCKEQGRHQYSVLNGQDFTHSRYSCIAHVQGYYKNVNKMKNCIYCGLSSIIITMGNHNIDMCSSNNPEMQEFYNKHHPKIICSLCVSDADFNEKDSEKFYCYLHAKDIDNKSNLNPYRNCSVCKLFVSHIKKNNNICNTCAPASDKKRKIEQEKTVNTVCTKRVFTTTNFFDDVLALQGFDDEMEGFEDELELFRDL
jgi:hypothetical protein